MKQRYNALDIKAAVVELRKQFTSCRVVNIYDCDHKTYLIKLNKPESKAVILIESGIRIHSTEFDLPKNVIPSGFSMKLRKHIRSRRLEKCEQVGADRIVDLQFGSNEAAYHLLIELYDRGNILLTDFEYTIISVLRPRTDENTDVKFTVKEKYPLHLARTEEKLTLERLDQIFSKTKPNDEVKKVLTANLTFGGALIEHCLSVGNFPDKAIIGKNFHVETDMARLFEALKEGDKIVAEINSGHLKGFIIQKKTKAPKLDTKNLMEILEEDVLIYEEFHPYLFNKFKSLPYIEFETFDKAVDEFYSKLETQKSEMKESAQNRDAVKKLDNVKKDHQQRIEKLKHSQTADEFKAQLIEYNLELVEHAIFLVNSAVANQLDWQEINEIIQDAREDGHTVALAIKELHLDINHVTLNLCNPDDEEDPEKLHTVKIDLGLNAYRNSRKFYEQKKTLFAKEKKTIDASDKALKSAEKRTLEILKQASKNQSITKSRKPYWFEKFFWFISSENYLVIGGHDQQQNEIIVKKHLRAGDLYVHADLNGASSVIIKNPTGKAVPPKTLNEAGSMAVCYSVAWEAKVLANAYWVHHDQVSKQAPSGEYIGTGSFMIRGKKNFLPQTALVFGLALMYKLDENSIARHEDDRKIKTLEEDELVSDKQTAEEAIEEEVPNSSNSSSESDKGELEDQPSNLSTVKEDEVKVEVIENEEKSIDNKAEFPDTAFQMKIVSDIKLEESEKKTESPHSESESESGSDGESAGGSKHIQGKTDNKATNVKAQNAPLKKGQKARLNKMKKKYKDQDEEDKELAMQLLGSKGNDQKKVKKSQVREEKKNQKKANQVAQQKKSKAVVSKADIYKKPIECTLPAVGEITAKVEGVKLELKRDEKEAEEENDGNEEFAEQQKEIDKALLNSLTGQPLDEDELLFAMTVCAPYSCITNYKHKVKLTPGTTKRGKAVKTAIEMFSRNPITSVKEKELIKTCLMKDQDGRNLPSKVKISAPNLNKLKKK